jgi:hypothetical protein
VARQNCKTGEFYSGAVNLKCEASSAVAVALVTLREGGVTQPGARLRDWA